MQKWWGGAYPRGALAREITVLLLQIFLILFYDCVVRVNMIVTETFDCGLLGEGVIPSLKHAHDYLIDYHAKLVNTTLHIFNFD